MKIKATDKPTGREWQIELSETEMFDMIGYQIMLSLMSYGVSRSSSISVAAQTLAKKDVADVAITKLDLFTANCLAEYHRLGGFDKNTDPLNFLIEGLNAAMKGNESRPD